MQAQSVGGKARVELHSHSQLITGRRGLVSTKFFPLYTNERLGTHCEVKWPGLGAHQYGRKILPRPGFGRRTNQPVAKLLYPLRCSSSQVLRVMSSATRKLTQNPKYNKFTLFIYYPTLSIQLLFTDESFVREGTFKNKGTLA